MRQNVVSRAGFVIALEAVVNDIIGVILGLNFMTKMTEDMLPKFPACSATFRANVTRKGSGGSFQFHSSGIRSIVRQLFVYIIEECISVGSGNVFTYFFVLESHVTSELV